MGVIAHAQKRKEKKERIDKTSGRFRVKIFTGKLQKPIFSLF